MPVVETPADGVVASSYPVCAVMRSIASSARTVDVSQEMSLRANESLLAAGTIGDAPVSSPQCEMGAAVMDGGAEGLRANRSLFAAGTRGDALMSLSQYQTGEANRRGVELPVVASDVLGVVSEGNSDVDVSVESDVHFLAEGTGGGAIASPSPGLDAGADCSHAGSPEKAPESLGVVLEVEDTSFPARRTRGNTVGSDGPLPLPDSQMSLLLLGSVFPRQLVSVGPA